MPRKLTKEEFIERAKAVHGDKYDYSKVEYVDSSTKVCITCDVHGDILISPNKHLSGQGCKSCGYIRNRTSIRKTTEYFVQKSREKHGGKYDYSKVVYKGADESVEIICPIHGSFWQRAASHAHGCGCQKCAIKESHDKSRKSTEQFIVDAKIVHGDRYNYELVEYKGKKTQVSIICKKHGIFKQTPDDHLQGHGCQKCANERNAIQKSMGIKEFILKAKEKHGNKYDYSLVKYINGKSRIDIICPIHGRFTQIAESHLQGKGCTKCKAENAKKPVCGVGINDVLDGQREKAYKHWQNMLLRCYNEKWRSKWPSYAECTVCEDWLTYSNFRKWFNDNYINGYQLDKDVLCKGSKIYSPNTCCFIPQRINSLLINHKAKRGKYPIGVTKYGRRYCAMISKNKEHFHIGVYDTAQEAFVAYKREKECYIKEVATEYYNEGKITENVYLALMNWRVEITD